MANSSAEPFTVARVRSNPVDLPLEARSVSMVAALVTDGRHIRLVLDKLFSLKLDESLAHLKRLKREDTVVDGVTGTRFLMLVSDIDEFQRLGGEVHGDKVSLGSSLSPPLSGIAAMTSTFCVVRVPAIAPLAKDDLYAESTSVWPMILIAKPDIRATTELPGEDASTEPGIVSYVSDGLALAHAQAEAGLAAGHQPKGCVIALPLTARDPTLPGAQLLTLGGRACELRGAGYDMTSLASASSGLSTARAYSTQTACMKAVAQAAELDLAHANRAARKPVPAAAGSASSEDDDVAGDTKRRRVDEASASGRSDSSTGAAAGAAEVSPSPAAEAVSRYVCTGSDAFLTHEPDLLDSMALLHARVSRIFFARRDTARGALAGNLRVPASTPDLTGLAQAQPRPGGSSSSSSSAVEPVVPLYFHECRALNHRYAVYTVVPEPAVPDHWRR